MESLQKILADDQVVYMSLVHTGEALKQHLRSFAFPVRRRMFDRLYGYITYPEPIPRVCILYGIRRTGKTVLMGQCMQALEEQDLSRTAFIQGNRHDNMLKLKKTLDLLSRYGVNKVFIDEATLIDDFSISAEMLADWYATSGMKIVLSGTDSLLFKFVKEHALYDRTITIGTTNILFDEHASITGKNNILNFIDNGGIFVGRYKIPDDGLATFEGPEQAEAYSNTAIAYNIQHSLENDDLENRFGCLVRLYNKGHLTNVICRLVNDINNRFTVKIITKEFKNEQAGLARHNIQKRSDLDRDDLSQIIEAMQDKDILAKFMQEFSILNIDQKFSDEPISQQHLDQISEYLQDISILRHYSLYKHNHDDGVSKEKVPFFVQPGLRFRQCESFLEKLFESDLLADIPPATGKILENVMLDTVRGKILEEIVIFEALESCPKRYEIFQYRDNLTSAEYDLVIRDKVSNTCDLYEIKLTNAFIEGHARHLRDDTSLDRFTSCFGKVAKRIVLYRGEDMVTGDGICWRNVETFLRQMAREFPVVGLSIGNNILQDDSSEAPRP